MLLKKNCWWLNREGRVVEDVTEDELLMVEHRRSSCWRCYWRWIVDGWTEKVELLKMLLKMNCWWLNREGRVVEVVEDATEDELLMVEQRRSSCWGCYWRWIIGGWTEVELLKMLLKINCWWLNREGRVVEDATEDELLMVEQRRSSCWGCYWRWIVDGWTEKVELLKMLLKMNCWWLTREGRVVEDVTEDELLMVEHRRSSCWRCYWRWIVDGWTEKVELLKMLLKMNCWWLNREGRVVEDATEDELLMVEQRRSSCWGCYWRWIVDGWTEKVELLRMLLNMNCWWLHREGQVVEDVTEDELLMVAQRRSSCWGCYWRWIVDGWTRWIGRVVEDATEDELLMVEQRRSSCWGCYWRWIVDGWTEKVELLKMLLKMNELLLKMLLKMNCWWLNKEGRVVEDATEDELLMVEQRRSKDERWIVDGWTEKVELLKMLLKMNCWWLNTEKVELLKMLLKMNCWWLNREGRVVEDATEDELLMVEQRRSSCWGCYWRWIVDGWTEKVELLRDATEDELLMVEQRRSSCWRCYRRWIVDGCTEKVELLRMLLKMNCWWLNREGRVVEDATEDELLMVEQRRSSCWGCYWRELLMVAQRRSSCWRCYWRWIVDGWTVVEKVELLKMLLKMNCWWLNREEKVKLLKMLRIVVAQRRCWRWIELLKMLLKMNCWWLNREGRVVEDATEDELLMVEQRRSSCWGCYWRWIVDGWTKKVELLKMLLKMNCWWLNREGRVVEDVTEDELLMVEQRRSSCWRCYWRWIVNGWTEKVELLRMLLKMNCWWLHREGQVVEDVTEDELLMVAQRRSSCWRCYRRWIVDGCTEKVELLRMLLKMNYWWLNRGRVVEDVTEDELLMVAQRRSSCWGCYCWTKIELLKMLLKMNCWWLNREGQVVEDVTEDELLMVAQRRSSCWRCYRRWIVDGWTEKVKLLKMLPKMNCWWLHREGRVVEDVTEDELLMVAQRRSSCWRCYRRWIVDGCTEKVELLKMLLKMLPKMNCYQTSQIMIEFHPITSCSCK